ncbi:MAG: outer membrane protein transport protein [Bacteroidales bacterium]|nr:outer membrane protein transport protein [Bacteroidales bacterium]
MKKIIILAVGVIFSFTAKAQVSEQYPLLLSQYGLNGTANYISRAGALGAVGGDITAASFNPAGLGLYLGNEMTIGSGLNFAFTTADYNGNKFNDDRTNYNFGNFGMVLNVNGGNGLFESGQIGFSFNQLKNYSNRINVARTSLRTSYISTIMDNILYTDDLFYQSGVVWWDSASASLVSNFTSGSFDQYKTIETYGFLTSMDFTFSTNINNIVFIGGAIGVPLFSYTQLENLTEQRYLDNGANGRDLTDEYNFQKKTELNGTGANFKLGVILQPVNWLRLGASVHTPTYYSIEDDYYARVDNAGYLDNYRGSADGTGETLLYDIQTPFRFIGSLALIMGTGESKVKGTISADYEYVNYSAMKFRFNDNGSAFNETQVNNNINSIYQPAHSLRLGGELKTGMLALRAGYAMIGNPYAKIENDASQQYITGGIGLKGKHCFLDLAYAYTLTGDMRLNRLYTADTYNPTSLSHNESLIQLTFGVRF